jgi:hypothetical protein
MWGRLLLLLSSSLRVGGPSSTRLVYLTTGLSGCFAALVTTGVLCGMYIAKGTVDDGFATASAGMWIAILGFAAGAQRHKNQADAQASATTYEVRP